MDVCPVSSKDQESRDLQQLMNIIESLEISL